MPGMFSLPTPSLLPPPHTMQSSLPGLSSASHARNVLSSHSLPPTTTTHYAIKSSRLIICFSCQECSLFPLPPSYHHHTLCNQVFQAYHLLLIPGMFSLPTPSLLPPPHTMQSSLPGLSSASHP